VWRDLQGDPQLSFGGGLHYCVGAPLARLEAQLGFQALLRRYPRLAAAQPAAAPRWRPMINVRGLDELWVLPAS
jgi:cytochrome P450